jgi:hypothetical protein
MTATMALSPASAATPEGKDFSVVLGGPLFQLLRRVRLCDSALGLLHRRIIAAILIMWAPLLVLSAMQGGLIGPGRTMPLLDDIAFHLRFLVATPLLIVAELVVHKRLRFIVDQFRIRALVQPQDASRFADAVNEAARLRNSVLAEALLLVFVYAAGELFTLHRYVALGRGTWYTSASAGGGLSLAGMWLMFVSLPLFQFLVLRWYFRLFIWARFLWRVSRLDLDLNVTHPDKAGGVGFLGASLGAFVPIAAAHGVLFAGVMANRIFYAGATLPQFKVEVIGGAAFLILVFAGPLAVFVPVLARVKFKGLSQYGALGQTYVREFRDKWIAGTPPPDEPLIGSGDIQSLADLGNSFTGAQQMRVIPIRLMGVAYFLAAFLAPMAPLLFTMMSVDKLISSLIGMVF